jgi:hypothetical protein
MVENEIKNKGEEEKSSEWLCFVFDVVTIQKVIM